MSNKRRKLLKILKYIFYMFMVIILVLIIFLAYMFYMPTNISSLTTYQQYLLVNGISTKPEDSSYGLYTDAEYLRLLNSIAESGYCEGVRFDAIRRMTFIYLGGARGESASVTNAYLYCKKEKALPKNAKLNLDCEIFSPYKQESY